VDDARRATTAFHHSERVLDPVEVLLRAGTATHADLVALCGRRALRRAVATGAIIRLARGRYALPSTPDPLQTAARLGGVVSHESAAEHLGPWLPRSPELPHVTVAPTRSRVSTQGAVVHWSMLRPGDVRGHHTSPLRTVLDVARTSGTATALSVADSALRQRLVRQADLMAAAVALRGPGSLRARRVVGWADRRSESVLESVLRSILLDAGLHGFEPQVLIGDDDFLARVDLAHRAKRLILEADSFEHHGHRAALARDCERYSELTVRDWRVLRFAWEQVMFRPDWVAAVVTRAYERQLAQHRRRATTSAASAYQRTGPIALRPRLCARAGRLLLSIGTAGGSGGLAVRRAPWRRRRPPRSRPCGR
jgi:very-short-patch-repair endonuclease